MRGSPLVRLVLVIVGMLGLIVPLRSLTMHDKSVAEPVAPAQPDRTVRVHVALSSTKVPFHFALNHLGQPLWVGDSTTEAIEKDIQMPFPREGIDLLAEASWSDAGSAVLKVVVTPQDGDSETRMLWGSGQVSDVLTFK